jgi:hypothetical protein
MEEARVESGVLPKDHWEKKYDCNDTSNLKYSGGYDQAPEELKSRSEKLSGYLKSKKESHD